MCHFQLRRWGVVAVCLFTLSTACNVQPGSQLGDGSDQDDGDTGGAKLAVFQDPDSDFSTSDVYDVGDQIVRFDTEAKTIIWVEDGRAFQEGAWEIDGNFLTVNAFFQVRFGNVDGERRAYFTETDTATICDIEVNVDDLFIIATNVPVPQ